MKEEKHLLFIAPYYYGFDDVVYFGLENYSDYNIHRITIGNTYKYSNLYERIINFFSKTFLNKNLKPQKLKKYQIKKINNIDSYDILIINRPDILDNDVLNCAISKSKNSIALFWDSLEKIQAQKERIQFFDKCFSFDIEDCVKYNLAKNNNFYFVTETIEKPEFDVFFFGTVDNRIVKLEKILNKLSEIGLNVSAKLYDPTNKKISEPNSKIKYLDKIIPFKDSHIFNQNTKVILDLKHDNQTGLSFRPFEALGMKKKLITDNKQIKNYDFYNPNNICIIDENHLNIPDSFFNTPYQELPENIYSKYNLENWIQHILET